jgi:hypothetical protein
VPTSSHASRPRAAPREPTTWQGRPHELSLSATSDEIIFVEPVARCLPDLAAARYRANAGELLVHKMLTTVLLRITGSASRIRVGEPD